MKSKINQIKFSCPSCSVFMRKYNKRWEPPRYICPICNSIFLPSEKAIEYELDLIADIEKAVLNFVKNKS